MSVSRPALISGIAGAVAVLAGLALAIAPVDASKAVVHWPAADAPLRSTALLLTNQTPHVLDLGFTAEDATAADAADGTVFSTIRPELADAPRLGLLVTADDGTLEVRSGGQQFTAAITDAEQWAVHSDIHGMVVTADGETVADWPDVLQPQVDALITSVPSAHAGIQATVQAVDDFNSDPTPLKVALMVVLWAALAVALVFLGLDDRRRRRAGAPAPPRPDRRWWQRWSVTDLVVVAALAVWIFIGPMTDDDGYYAVMSYNNAAAGYVGNYYQMFNQPFTPFTWFWQFLDVWQQLGGRSAVWLRVPSLLAAAAAWLIVRRFLDRTVEERGPWVRAGSRWFLAAVFLAWWMPYAIGSRPEVLGSLGAVVALALVVRAVERGTLLPAAFGALAAGLAFAAHPTGGVAFAPLILAVPALWRIARTDGPVGRALLRTVGVLSVGSVALFAAFADGTLSDALVGRERFAAVETPQTWADEFNRYAFLFGGSPMGSFAKRAAVLVALVMLVWFIALYVATRIRRTSPMPRRVWMTGWSFGLSLLLLWITPSKWTHHFGAISSLGPLFIVLVAVLAPRILDALLGGKPLPHWLAPVAVASFLPAIVLTFIGPNWWAYSWYDAFFPHDSPTRVDGITLSKASYWILAAALAIGASYLAVRFRRRLGWRSPAMLGAVGVLLAGFFLVDLAVLGVSFGRVALRDDLGFSTAQANLADPSGQECRIDDAITLWDAGTGTPMQPQTAGDPGPFSTDGLVPATTPLPTGFGQPAWSSLDADGHAGVGTGTSDWYRLPDGLAADDRVAFLAAGSVYSRAAGLVAFEFGSGPADAIQTDSSVPVSDPVSRVGWRTLVAAVPDGAEWVRVRGTTTSTDPGNWVGFTAPVIAHARTMRETLPAGDPVAVTWMSVYWFPCQRPLTIANGIIEPPTFATTFGAAGNDNIWVVQRGGSLAGAARLASVTTAAGDMPGVGPDWGRVHRFDYPVARGAYDLELTRVTTPGWKQPFGPTSQQIEYEQRQ